MQGRKNINLHNDAVVYIDTFNIIHTPALYCNGYRTLTNALFLKCTCIPYCYSPTCFGRAHDHHQDILKI
jgi:hypothetical protein